MNWIAKSQGGVWFEIVGPSQMGNMFHKDSAYLIAAAPDMLHELERIRWIVSDEDAEIINAVIAKAKGESVENRNDTS